MNQQLYKVKVAEARRVSPTTKSYGGPIEAAHTLQINQPRGNNPQLRALAMIFHLVLNMLISQLVLQAKSKLSQWKCRFPNWSCKRNEGHHYENVGVSFGFASTMKVVSMKMLLFFHVEL